MLRKHIPTSTPNRVIVHAQLNRGGGEKRAVAAAARLNRVRAIEQPASDTMPYNSIPQSKVSRFKIETLTACGELVISRAASPTLLPAYMPAVPESPPSRKRNRTVSFFCCKACCKAVLAGKGEQGNDEISTWSEAQG
ncbi:hypothetical protein JHW43_002368 [Diplocarpon mali]|nr:hypothetical protein JHW43_002368 [Diplocarpon mali]